MLIDAKYDLVVLGWFLLVGWRFIEPILNFRREQRRNFDMANKLAVSCRPNVFMIGMFNFKVLKRTFMPVCFEESWCRLAKKEAWKNKPRRQRYRFRSYVTSEIKG